MMHHDRDDFVTRLCSIRMPEGAWCIPAVKFSRQALCPNAPERSDENNFVVFRRSIITRGQGARMNKQNPPKAEGAGGADGMMTIGDVCSSIRQHKSGVYVYTCALPPGPLPCDVCSAKHCECALVLFDGSHFVDGALRKLAIPPICGWYVSPAAHVCVPTWNTCGIVLHGATLCQPFVSH